MNFLVTTYLYDYMKQVTNLSKDILEFCKDKNLKKFSKLPSNILSEGKSERFLILIL